MGSIKPPSANEVDYFKKLEIRRLRAAAAARRALTSEQERTQTKELHYMHCPKCGEDLETVHMYGIQVETCPACQGIWLDKGELEAILEHEDKGLLDRIIALFRSDDEDRDAPDQQP